eukprot:2567384-Ditylum_brightwellii.AAC.1
MDLQEGEFETLKRIVFRWTFLFSTSRPPKDWNSNLKTMTLSSQQHQFCQDPAATSKNSHTPPPQNSHAPPPQNSHAPPPQNSHTPPPKEQIRTITATAIQV